MTDQPDLLPTHQATSEGGGTLVLTLTEASARTGLTVEALRQRIKRRQLRSVLGNDRLVRVHLTPADLERLTQSRPKGQPAGQPDGHLVNLGSASELLERFEAMARKRLELVEELVEERTRRGAAEVELADAKRHIVSLQQASGPAHVRELEQRHAAERATREAADAQSDAEKARKAAARAVEERDEARERARRAEADLETAREALGRRRGRGLLSRLLNRNRTA